MIRNINGGRYVNVTGGSVGNPYISPGAAGAGMMRWNPNMNQIEVNDGNSWKQLDVGYATVDLNSEAQELLEWARKKRTEERELDELCKKYPGLRKARDNYELFLNLVQGAEVQESVQSSP